MKPFPLRRLALGLCLLFSRGFLSADTDPEKIVVTVNGTPILEKQILAEADERINIYAARTGAKGLVYEESSRGQTRDFLRDEVINALIGRILTGEQLKADGIEITEADIDAFYVAKLKARGQTAAEAEKEIAAQGKSMQGVRDRIRWNNLAVQKLYAVHDQRKRTFSEEQARLVYQADPGAYKQEHERRVSRILIIATPDHDAAFRKAARERAEAVLARARAGEDFAALVRECSEDEFTRKRDGDRGWSPRGFVTAPGNDPFGDAAFALKAVGDLSGIVETLDGYEIIKLTGLREERQKTFDEVKNDIIAQKNYYYIGDFWDDFSARMKQKARIEFSPEELARKAEKERKEREYLATQATQSPPEAAAPPTDFVRKRPAPAATLNPPSS